MNLEPSDLLGAGDAARLLGVKPSAFANLQRRGRLPAPYARLSSGPVYVRADIEGYAAERAAIRAQRAAELRIRAAMLQLSARELE